MTWKSFGKLILYSIAMEKFWKLVLYSNAMEKLWKIGLVLKGYGKVLENWSSTQRLWKSIKYCKTESCCQKLYFQPTFKIPVKFYFAWNFSRTNFNIISGSGLSRAPIKVQGTLKHFHQSLSCLVLIILRNLANRKTILQVTWPLRISL